MDTEIETQETNYSEKPVNINEQLTWGKLFILGLVSVSLCSFAPLSLFSPIPMATAFLLYGRQKGFILAGVTSVLIFLLGTYQPFFYDILVLYVGAAIYGSLISEVIFRKYHPVRGMVIAAGIILGGLLSFYMLANLVVEDFSFKEQVEKSVMMSLENVKKAKIEIETAGGDEARLLNDLLEKPEVLISQIMDWLPLATFMSTFLVLWVGLLAVLRNSLIWRGKLDYPFIAKDLLHFKVPDFFIWPLIIGLMLAIGENFIFGKEVWLGETGVFIGQNILYGLGIFYFFQGVGIYLDILSSMRIFGFLRSFLLIFTVFMAWRILVLVGILDLWIDFRKFFKRKNTKE